MQQLTPPTARRAEYTRLAEKTTASSGLDMICAEVINSTCNHCYWVNQHRTSIPRSVEISHELASTPGSS